MCHVQGKTLAATPSGSSHGSRLRQHRLPSRLYDMIDPEIAPLAGWDSFYVIVGSSGAALIGLQFVVIALVADQGVRSMHAIRAFATPTIVHFAGALVFSTVMSAPWRTLDSVAWTLRMLGLGGVLYTMLTLWRTRVQKDYRPVGEDWLWHVILPFAAYGSLLVAAILLRSREGGALFVIAAMVLSLLVIGIHNAWDTVVYMVVEQHAPAANDATTARPSE
jgi:hypothetical protein